MFLCARRRYAHSALITTSAMSTASQRQPVVLPLPATEPVTVFTPELGSGLRSVDAGAVSATAAPVMALLADATVPAVVPAVEAVLSALAVPAAALAAPVAALPASPLTPAAAAPVPDCPKCENVLPRLGKWKTVREAVFSSGSTVTVLVTRTAALPELSFTSYVTVYVPMTFVLTELLVTINAVMLLS